MKRKLFYLLAVALSLSVIMTGCKKEVAEPESIADRADQPGLKIGDVIPGSYIVVLAGNDRIEALQQQPGVEMRRLQAAVRELADPVMSRNAVRPEQLRLVYGTVLTGFSVEMTAEQARLLASDPAVLYVEPDRLLGIDPVPELKKKPPPPPPAAQTTPWGITRVGGPGSTASGTAWVIDTGIDLDHPDLNVNSDLSVSFVSNSSTPDDLNGHGSHVAGTIAAINNNIGVVGVAPGAEVVSVRVLGRNGTGYMSWIIAGVNYVGSYANDGDVANMSLGGSYYEALNTAVLNASNPCYFTLAAGNEYGNANNYSPGSTNGSHIFTISAMDANDYWASFSNYGNPPIDYCAPGVSIYSCYKNGGYATMSGTSMAAPHVAGIRLLGNISTDGDVNGDPDGNPDPIAHR